MDCINKFKQMFKAESTENGGDTGVWFRNGKFKDMAREFLHKAHTFVDTMGEGEENKDERGHHRGGHGHHGHHGPPGHHGPHGHHGPPGHHGPHGHEGPHHGPHGHWRGERKEWGPCGERSKWGNKRAIIIRKPEEVLVGEPGKIIFAEVEVQNETKWPWKYGCYVGLA